MKKQYNISPQTREFLSQQANSWSKYSKEHSEYLSSLKDSGVTPKVVYDIGSSLKQWTMNARTVWPDANYYLFDATRSVEFLYENENYYIGVLSDQEKHVVFYEHPQHVGGNSVYRENPEFSKGADILYGKDNETHRLARRLDVVVKEKGFPQPDLIKLDVQGSELDILRGAGDLLNNVEHIILELQKVEYNKGAPRDIEVVEALNEMGFRVANMYFTQGLVDGDCHFIRK
jgi:FkbM family methyltransferase